MATELEALEHEDNAPIAITASVQDALDMMELHNVDLLGVYTSGRNQKALCGTISRAAIAEYYR